MTDDAYRSSKSRMVLIPPHHSRKKKNENGEDGQEKSSTTPKFDVVALHQMLPINVSMADVFDRRRSDTI